MMKKQLLGLSLMIILATSGGCAYRYYLGMHGPSIKESPQVHNNSLTDDAQCLGCHLPKNGSSDAPQTSHPHFKGCLACHNDPLRQ